MTEDKKDTKQEPRANDSSAEERPDPGIKPPVRRSVGELRRNGSDRGNDESD